MAGGSSSISIGRGLRDRQREFIEEDVMPGIFAGRLVSANPWREPLSSLHDSFRQAGASNSMSADCCSASGAAMNCTGMRVTPLVKRGAIMVTPCGRPFASSSSSPL